MVFIKSINWFVLLWPVVRAVCSCCPSLVVWMQEHQRATSVQLRGRGNREKVGNLTVVVSVFVLPPFLLIFPWFSLLDGGFTLEPQSVFLCIKICLVLVPFPWGQALFRVEVLRIYPNVQDLGVSARLSESGGKEGGRQCIIKCNE